MKSTRKRTIWQRILATAVALCTVLGSTLVLLPAHTHTHASAASTVSDGTFTSVDTTMALGVSNLDDPTAKDTADGRYYVPSDYVYLGKNSDGVMSFRVLSANTDNAGNEGGVFILAEVLADQSLSNVDFDSAYLSYFSTAEQEALISPAAIGNYADADSTSFGKNWTSAQQNTAIFALSAEELATYVADYTGASALRAYTDSTRSTVGSWWLRSSDDAGRAYVSAAQEIAVESNLLSARHYDRMATNLNASHIMFTTKVDGGHRLSLLDSDYAVAGNQTFMAWITDINGTELEVSYVNAKPSVEDGALGEYISAIITDTDGKIKYYGKLEEAPSEAWKGSTSHHEDGSVVAPGEYYEFQDSVTFDVAGLYDGTAGDKIYVFWEKAYDEATLESQPALAYESTVASEMAELCFHDVKWEATCTTFKVCGKCDTHYGGYDYHNLSAHVEVLTDYYTGEITGFGASTLTWTQKEGAVYDERTREWIPSILHTATCSQCDVALPVDENNLYSGGEACVNATQTPTCTTAVKCDVCGLDFVNPTAHDYDENGICRYNHAHFEEPQYEDGHYVIENVGQMIWYADYINALGADDGQRNACLEADIDFSVLESYDGHANYNWTPIGNFKTKVTYGATFDGQGHVIKNLTCIAPADDDGTYCYMGFFGYVENATIKNLGIVSSTFSSNITEGASFNGALAGLIADAGTSVFGCFAEDVSITAAQGVVGGLVGFLRSGDSVRDCYAIDLTLTESGASSTAWIFGTSEQGSVENCFAYGDGAAITKSGRWSNCYYLVADDASASDAGKTAAQFASGEVAYLLGEGWGQTLESQSYPVRNGQTVYRVEVCGSGFAYSNTNETTHESSGHEVCGEQDICQSCGLPFGEVFEHEYNALVEFIWGEASTTCKVQTKCTRCGELNPVLIDALVSENFLGGVRAEYVASVYLDGKLYTSDPVRYIIIEIQTMIGLEAQSVPFTGKDYYARDLIDNTRLKDSEYEVYFLTDGEYVGDFAYYAGTYDLHVVGKGNYDYQEYTFEDIFTITPVTVDMTVGIEEKVFDETKSFNFTLDFDGDHDYSHLFDRIWADQAELPSADVGEYTITGIECSFYDSEVSDSITVNYNKTAVARVLPRNHVKIKNIGYATEYTYGDTIPDPRATDFETDEGSVLTFTWFEGENRLASTPTDAGEYKLVVHASATDEFIASTLEIDVTINRKELFVIFDLPEDIEYVDDEYGNRWYIVEMGDALVPKITDGETVFSDHMGFDFIWWIYSGMGSQQRPIDNSQHFPSYVNHEHFYIEVRTDTAEYFGINYNYYCDTGASIYVMVEFPEQNTLVPVDVEYEYDGTAKGYEFYIEFDELEFSEGFYSVWLDYRTVLSTDNNFDNSTDNTKIASSSLYYDKTDIYGNYNAFASFNLTTGYDAFYARTQAVFENYETQLSPDRDEILFHAKITTTITDANGNEIDEMVEVGTYTVTYKIEYLDADGSVTATEEKTSTVTIKPAKKELWIFVKECEVELDGEEKSFDIDDIKIVPGYNLDIGHEIVDLSYRVHIGHAGFANQGEITVNGWVIHDADGNDVSDQYTVLTTVYDWEDYPYDYWRHTNGGENVVHIYSNACDATCNIEDCTVTRTVGEHTGGVASCTQRAICEICGQSYGAYDDENHVSDKVIYVQNQSDFQLHNVVNSCCGAVIRTEAHTVVKAATCTTLAECSLCGIVGGSYDYGNHVSTDMHYEINSLDSSLHDHVHSCCDRVESSEVHTVGTAATCMDRAFCSVCALSYGDFDLSNHVSEDFTYTVNTDHTGKHDKSHKCCGAFVAIEAHFGGAATCTDPAKCDGCGEQYGYTNPENHAAEEIKYSPNLVDNVHYTSHACCGAAIGTEAHSGGSANCQEKARCAKCGVEYGETNPSIHASENFTYSVNAQDADKHDLYTACCGALVSSEAHSGGTASCETQATCELCKEKYGTVSDHVYDNVCDGDCNVCGLERLPGHEDKDGDASCDYCGKSDAIGCVHVYDSVCDGKCNLCGVEREVAGHADENGDKVCDRCGKPYDPNCAHTYDNACDSTCNLCGTERDVADHADANGDELCDTCGKDLSSDKSSKDSDRLSDGAVVGITIGSTAAASVGGFSLFWFVIKKKKLIDLLGLFKK